MNTHTHSLVLSTKHTLLVKRDWKDLGKPPSQQSVQESRKECVCWCLCKLFLLHIMEYYPGERNKNRDLS